MADLPGRVQDASPPAFGDGPGWAFLSFLGLWLGVSHLLAWASGHMTLLSRYPPQQDVLEASFDSASGQMRWVSYGNALHVGIGARGLHLAANWLFQPLFRRGIPCIPWGEVRCIRAQRGRVRGWFMGSKFERWSTGIRFSLAGEPGRAVERKVASLGLGGAVDRSDAPGA